MRRSLPAPRRRGASAALAEAARLVDHDDRAAPFLAGRLGGHREVAVDGRLPMSGERELFGEHTRGVGDRSGNPLGARLDGDRRAHRPFGGLSWLGLAATRPLTAQRAYSDLRAKLAQLAPHALARLGQLGLEPVELLGAAAHEL